MPVSNRLSTTPTAAANDTVVRHVGHALALLAPRWRTWVLQTLAQNEQGMPRKEVIAALPFIPSGSQHHVLTGLTKASLIERPTNPEGGRIYRLTTAGRRALPIHQDIADWARRHVCPGETLPLAEAAEIGFVQIMGVNTIDTLAAVQAVGQAAAADLTGLRPHVTRAEHASYLHDAYHLGLLDRVERGRYELSPAAHDLEPVLSRLAEFAAHHRTTTPAALPTRPVSRTATAEAQGAAPRTTGSARAASAAAVPTRATPPRSVPATAARAPGPRQAPAVPQVAFSHPVGPFGTGNGPARGRW
ncbi:hypothetical protein GCM10023205_04480 [Yinghuangia aomiensis]|uniref:HTH hxlR-type domain-containing protein n=1 Tax=Yinghuangia aomiensis TaxID=676205 RepID=A0ABP9GLV6_9ACTN